MSTIFQKIEENQQVIKKQIDNLEKKAEKQAEKKIMKQRITVMVAGLNFWEKLELALKIFS